MTDDSKIAKVVTRRNLHDEDNGNAEYWSKQTPQARIDQLERIRREYHGWKLGEEPRLERVYRIVKLK